MKKNSFLLSFLAAVLFTVSACAPGGIPNISQPAVTPIDAGVTPPDAALKAVETLAKELSLAFDQITIQSVEEVQWSDSCLGLGKAEEMCAAVITPGFRVVLSVEGQTYEFHTDQSGSSIRRAAADLLDAQGSLAVAKLAELTGLPQESIQLVNSQAVEWSDGCLGAAQPGEACPELVVAGYRVELKSGGKSYILHANQDFSAVRIGGPEEAVAILKVRERAAQERGVNLADVAWVSSESVEWRDSCLGIETPGIMCLTVITPGYRIKVKAGDTVLEYHTNKSASSIKLFKP